MGPSGLHHLLPMPVISFRKLQEVDVKTLEKLTTGTGAAESPLDWARGRLSSNCGPASHSSSFSLWADTNLYSRAHIWISGCGHTSHTQAELSQSKLICWVSKGPSQSDSTLPTQPCFPWFPNSSLGFKPSGLLMVPWGNIPGSFTEFLRPAMPLCFVLVNQIVPNLQGPNQVP